MKMLKIGTSVGVETCLQWGEEEEIGVAVKKDQEVKKGIERVMGVSEEGEEIRERCKESLPKRPIKLLKKVVLLIKTYRCSLRM